MSAQSKKNGFRWIFCIAVQNLHLIKVDAIKNQTIDLSFRRNHILMFVTSINFYNSDFAYRRHNDHQELLSLELLHRAHFDVRQAHLTQQHSDLLRLESNEKTRTLSGYNMQR